MWHGMKRIKFQCVHRVYIKYNICVMYCGNVGGYFTKREDIVIICSFRVSKLEYFSSREGVVFNPSLTVFFLMKYGKKKLRLTLKY